MKIISLKGALGNQMFQYAVYLQLKKMYPDEDIFVDTSILRYWKFPNELTRVFGIDLTEYDYYEYMKKKGVPFEEECQKYRFWEDRGYDSFLSYAKSNNSVILATLSYSEIPEIYLSYGEKYVVEPQSEYRIDKYKEMIGSEKDNNQFASSTKSLLIEKLFGGRRSRRFLFFRALSKKQGKRRMIKQFILGEKPDFCASQSIERFNKIGDVYFNSYGDFEDCIGVEDELRKVFRYPETNSYGKLFEDDILNSESVGIHVRAGAFSYGVADILKRKYFVKSVKYIHKRLGNSVKFFIFSDDMKWCKNNLDILGLKEENNVVFVEDDGRVDGIVDGNDYTLMDMKLMSECKHLITSNSTFSWWAGFLNPNLNKIMITPTGTMPGTISF